MYLHKLDQRLALVLSSGFIFVSIFQQSCFGNCLKQADVATKTMNDYVRTMDAPGANRFTWVNRNAILTNKFKVSFKKIYSAPQIDFDPILDAQDYPDRGFEFDSCKSQPQFVTLRGIGWKNFKVVVKVIKRKNRWFVDGAGVVNIPKNKQARR